MVLGRQFSFSKKHLRFCLRKFLEKKIPNFPWKISLSTKISRFSDNSITSILKSVGNPWRIAVFENPLSIQFANICHSPQLSHCTIKELVQHVIRSTNGDLDLKILEFAQYESPDCRDCGTTCSKMACTTSCKTVLRVFYMRPEYGRSSFGGPVLNIFMRLWKLCITFSPFRDTP